MTLHSVNMYVNQARYIKRPIIALQEKCRNYYTRHESKHIIVGIAAEVETEEPFAQRLRMDRTLVAAVADVLGGNVVEQ